jgi:hypothetical protein
LAVPFSSLHVFNSKKLSRKENRRSAADFPQPEWLAYIPEKARMLFVKVSSGPTRPLRRVQDQILGSADMVRKLA